MNSSILIGVRKPFTGAMTAAVGALVLHLTACESITPVELPQYRSELVVLSWFDPESPWEVTVLRTVGIEEEVAKDDTAILDARVEIWEGSTRVAELRHVGEGLYGGVPTLPQRGRTYTLRVSAADYEVVTATGTVPSFSPAPALSFVDSIGYYQGHPEAELRLRFTDPAETKDYYMLELLGDYGAGLNPINYRTSDPILREGSLANFFQDQEGGGTLFFSDVAFAGTTVEFLTQTRRYPANGFAAVLYRLDEGYYRYLQSLRLMEQSEGNPFAEAAQPYTNVRGGRGIFAGFVRQQSNPVHLNEITTERIAGSYESKLFAFRSGEQLTTLTPDQAALELLLSTDGSVSGRLLIQRGFDPTNPDRELVADLEGTFQYDGRHVRFFLEPPTFLNDVAWIFLSNGACATCGTLRSEPDQGEFVVLLTQRAGS